MKLPLLVLGLLAALLLLGIWESLRHRKNIHQIPLRILVNGTRGKTSTTRLLTAALQGGGIKTRGKSTGTDPREILPDGSEVETLRKRGARITEVKGFFRHAVKDNAQAVVVECMAVHPEMQSVFARLLVRPTHTIITNAWVDHVEEIGATREETAESLSYSLIPGTVLITDDEAFLSHSGRVPGDQEPLPENYAARFSFPIFEANVRLALAAAKLCGVSRDAALDAMPSAQPDAGMAGPFRMGNSTIFNAFAANDPLSAKQAAQRVRAHAQDGALTLVYNNRADREYRLATFLPVLKSLEDLPITLYIVGDNAGKVARYFGKRFSFPCLPLDEAKLLEEAFYQPQQTILGLGNTKGPGHNMLRYLIDKGRIV